MSANSFGSRWVITSFGESHGPALGVIIDGCPAGVPWDEQLLRKELTRRRPGTQEKSGAQIVSARREEDLPEVLSGIYEGKTLGTPIAIMVRNQDARSDDYAAIAQASSSVDSASTDKAAGAPGAYRAGHADDLWRAKFGHSDIRGGGRSSGRETVARVMGGAVAQMFFRATLPQITIKGFAAQLGPFELSVKDRAALETLAPGAEGVDLFTARFPSVEGSRQVEALLTQARKDGRSYGGVAEFWVDGAPRGLGQPVFHKLKADLAAAVMSVGATAGVEIGDGFEAVQREGSEFHSSAGAGVGASTRYGGIRGGISTGERIVVRAAFKPTSSVLDVAKKGRHDPCIVPRAIPVIESMIALVLADHLLWARMDRV